MTFSGSISGTFLSFDPSSHAAQASSLDTTSPHEVSCGTSFRSGINNVSIECDTDYWLSQWWEELKKKFPTFSIQKPLNTSSSSNICVSAVTPSTYSQSGGNTLSQIQCASSTNRRQEGGGDPLDLSDEIASYYNHDSLSTTQKATSWNNGVSSKRPMSFSANRQIWQKNVSGKRFVDDNERIECKSPKLMALLVPSTSTSISSTLSVSTAAANTDSAQTTSKPSPLHSGPAQVFE